jgi:hypothetical protein
MIGAVAVTVAVTVAVVVVDVAGLNLPLGKFICSISGAATITTTTAASNGQITVATTRHFGECLLEKTGRGSDRGGGRGGRGGSEPPSG